MTKWRRNDIYYQLNTALAYVLLMIINVSAKHLTDLRWNSANSLFGSDLNSPNGLQKELFPFLTVGQNDDVDFVCPERQASEWLTVHLVSEMSFLTCQLDSSAFEFLVCDSIDGQPRRKHVTFGESANSPVSFTHGHSYYFITTSSGSKRGIRNTFGGLCATKNMRLKIDVVLNLTDEVKKEASTLAPSIEYFIEEREPESAPLSANDAVSQRAALESNVIAPAIAVKYSRSLADILHVNPEHIDFVRRHAVNGGTGAIAFPSSNAEKRPRFVEPIRPERRNQDFYMSADDVGRQTAQIDMLENSRNFNEKSQFGSQIADVNDVSLQNSNLISMKVYADSDAEASGSSSPNISFHLVSTAAAFLILILSSILY